MSDHRDTFAEELRDQMPPAASPEALERVRLEARTRSGGHPRRNATRWRLAGGLVAAAMAVLIALAVVPRLQTAAFAREQAADALLLQTDGKALHATLHYTSTGWTEEFGHDARYDLDQRWSFWIDPARKLVREEYVNLPDGTLDGLSVRVGDRTMTFQNNVRYGTGEAQQLIDFDVTGQPIATTMGTIIDYLRAGIEDGTAKVKGTKTIDGEEYWVVELAEPQDPSIDGKSVITATMRTSDYRLKTWSRESSYHNGNGDGTSSERIEFELTEQLEPSALPADFFSFDAVTAAARPGTKVERR